jgi:hypothetical protein
MSTAVIPTQSTTYRLGWWVLFGISALSVLSYVALIFVAPNSIDSLIAWATFSLYSVIVVLIPYRHGERWAWYLTWVLVVPAVVLSLNDRDAAPYFLAAVGLTVLGQLLTRGAFFPRAERSRIE